MSERYRVLKIAPTPFFADRGAHVRIYEEAKALMRLGHQVIICTYHLGRNLDNVQTVRTLEIPWYRKLDPGPSPHKLYLDLFLLLRGMKVVRTFKPHVIHAHLHEGAMIAGWLRRLCGTPYVFDCQGSLTEELTERGAIQRGSRFFNLTRAMEARIYRDSPHVLTSSPNLYAMLQQQFRLPEQKLWLVEDGVDPWMFANGSRQSSEVRTQLSVPDDKKVFTYLGTFDKVSGVDLMLEAIALLVAKRRDVHFVLMGYPNVEHYRAMAERLGVVAHVTFTGRTPYERCAQFLTVGDFALAPKNSSSEGQGKLFNYMAAGLPTVAFDNVLNRRSLEDDGIYAHSHDAAAFAEAMAWTLDHAEEARQKGQQLRQRVMSKFSWDNIIQTVIASYGQALNGESAQLREDEKIRPHVAR
jgi:glycosyltransferase involved in cell wall biosynthesis